MVKTIIEFIVSLLAKLIPALAKEGKKPESLGMIQYVNEDIDEDVLEDDTDGKGQGDAEGSE